MQHHPITVDPTILHLGEPISLAVLNLELNRVMFRLNQRSRATLAFETPASRLQASVASIH